MNLRAFSQVCVCFFAGLFLSSCVIRDTPRPNIILIVADDLGYGDLGSYRSEKHRTPHLDKMAKEGMTFTSFYSTSGVCTPSRSSIMTGCYAQRTSMHVDEKNLWVLFPNAKKGLNPDEETIAELLKDDGYATACIGKWHLGDQPEFLPNNQGFDYYFGIPYSNDMNRKDIPLPLMLNGEVIEAPVNQEPLTKRYTEEAIKFIEENKARPFFIYLPHTMVHLPLQATASFRGRSKGGRYGDAVEELDWSTGEILKKIKQLGLDDNTMVIFTSDNGSYNVRAGSNNPLRGKKGDTDEGSMRVPFIVRYPGKISKGAFCTALTSTMDLLPTFTGLAGAGSPSEKIDGKDIWGLMKGKETESPHQAFFYYHTTQLQAVRSGRWKLVLPQLKKKRGWSSVESKTPSQLFDLNNDIHEDRDVSGQNAEVVLRLLAYANKVKLELGNNGSKGSGQREAGWVEMSKPLLKK
jgi:arylsulfatase A